MMYQLGKVCYIFFMLLLLFDSAFELSWGDERLALLQLRSSLGLRAKEWPIKGNHCSNWKGITCKNGRITEINISGFKRTRNGNQNPQFLIDALQNLTLLESFNASNFALPGSIPDWFGIRLVFLQVLDLRFCSITGVIPSTLGNLSSLIVLYLSNNGLSGMVPSSLSQLSSLSVFDLSYNSLVGSIPASFGSLGNLTLLDMSSNNLSGAIPPVIGTLSKLKFLNLSNNSLSSLIPAQLGDLSSLVDLDLSLNSLAGVVPNDLRGLRNLRRMKIGKNSLSGLLPGHLFVPLSQLQFLEIDHNNFTGSLPDVFWSMPGLQFLDASANNFTGTLSTLGSNVKFPSAVVNLSQNMFYGNLPPVVRRFSFLDLSDNYFQGKVPEYWQRNVPLNRNCLQRLGSQRNTSECASFYNERSLIFDNFGVPNAIEPPFPKSDTKSHKNVITLAAVLGGIGFIAIVIIFIMMLIFCCCKRGVTNQKVTGVEPVPASASPPGASLNFSNLGEAFNYQQILKTTGEFSDANLIKHGHSGDLFRGILEGGIHVVVKRIVKKEAYLSELDLFSKVSHSRVVPLLGHCLENENEKFLVYKYMPNGDLSSSLFRKNNSDDHSLQSLDWITRLKIAIGAAEGLSYLHHECYPPLVHRDIQASSILLDDKFEVRLGSLNEVYAQGGDTYHNRISRLLRLPQTSEQGASGSPNATCAYDVYCFGKVLLELVTGKLGISASSDDTMKEWLEKTLSCISIYDKELVTNIVDPSLIIDEDLLEEVWAMAIVAKSCLNPKPLRRPLMRYILKALENPLKVVREEYTSSERLRATSSKGSWNATLFGSWLHSSSDAAAADKVERASSFKRSATTGSRESGHSFSARQHSKEIFPEPLDVQDVTRTRDE
ncbi:probable LRR receptor-like serine/threonine-protein kinase At2g16250 [Lycium barbarum]|uniref:probable LRR receptor-like serine/threonine-protein kinase At2g16250 n=1 Tax=Lycium barbarum TaxID=112863 RepID=UPI00293F0558|nr:probable LRR receptor-like serine/threonine-protein kinase At2g16250 [Lycium barbarum]